MNKHDPSIRQGTLIIRNVSVNPITNSEGARTGSLATYGALLMSLLVMSGKDLDNYFKVLIKSILK